MVDEKQVWSFGFGSNMDVEHLRIKKEVTVLDYTPAVLKGWRIEMMSKNERLIAYHNSPISSCRLIDASSACVDASIDASSAKVNVASA